MFTQQLAIVASRGEDDDCQPLSSPTRARTYSVDSPSLSAISAFE